MRLYSYLEELITESINDKGIMHACFMSGSSACFDESTLVLTKEGYKKISEINTNDIILTYNENTETDEWNYVKEVFEYNIDKEILKLEFDNGEIVICTEDHEFYVDGSWVKASDL